MASKKVHIALGSNLGDRGDTLMRAIKKISEAPGITVKRISNFIETEPLGGPKDQGKYYNAAAEIETTLSPQQLLEALQKIETSLGRDRSKEQRWGSRTCDLDILLIEDEVIDSETLTVPHPRMHERLFVLRPLAEIAPDAVHPKLNLTIEDLLLEAECSK